MQRVTMYWRIIEFVSAECPHILAGEKRVVEGMLEKKRGRRGRDRTQSREG